MRYHLVSGMNNQDSPALVWGGGLAALLAARVLVDQFPQVTLVGYTADSSDQYPLGLRGQRILEQLFPGITTQLILAGAPSIEWTAECLLLLPPGWMPRFHSTQISRLASPVLLERIVRQRLQEYGGSRITFDQSPITGYVRHGNRISGLNRADNQALNGQVVINTLPQVPQIASSQSNVQTLSTGIHSTSAIFQPKTGFSVDWKALMVFPSLQPVRGGILLPTEGGRWLVTLFGHDSQLPATAADFSDFARSLSQPALLEALQAAEPLTESSHPAPINLRRFNPDQHWPDNLLWFADHGGFSSVHQAITSAVSLSEALREQRRLHPEGDLTSLAQRFQSRQQLSPITWWLARLGVDSQTMSANLPLRRLITGYRQRLINAAPADMTLARLIWQSVHQETSWHSWLKPTILAKMLMAHPRKTEPAPAPTPPQVASVSTPRKITTAELSAIVDLHDPTVKL